MNHDAEQHEFGDADEQILKGFRQMAKSLVDTFRSRRDHVHQLLGSSQNYSSGIFREGLLRDFLREFLPRAVEVSTGFIYGFEKIPNSRQLDVLVWDSLNHAAVYKADSFVIVPPEAVILTVSVKTGMEPSEMIEAASNLLSSAPLDITYRGQLRRPLPPIAKFILAFDGSSSATKLAIALGHYFEEQFARTQILADAVVPVLARINPHEPARADWWAVDRVLPRLISSLDDRGGCAFLRGWGPGLETLEAKHGIRRLPYLYPLGSRITTFFEKFLYHVLSAVYEFLETRGRSLTAAWGDFHPVYGFRIGDADEVSAHLGYQLLNPDTVLTPRTSA